MKASLVVDNTNLQKLVDFGFMAVAVNSQNFALLNG
jgi:hypothetical protein